MRTFLILLGVGLIPAAATADDGDDTLRAYLAKSDVVVLGEFTSDLDGVTGEAGVVHYAADFKIARLLKGEARGERRVGGTLKVTVVRFEAVPEDRTPELKKGGKAILFLKATHVTADVWFGVQRPSPWMAKSLTRLAAEKAAKGDPITAEMRAALERANKAHAGMDRKALDEAIEDLHREIAKHDAKVFVPLAIPCLMALAPKETRTRTVLRKALAEGWLAEPTARALLVQAGDTPEPHVKAMLKLLGDAKARRAALEAARGFGAEGGEMLPALRKIIADAKADPTDFRRAYVPGRGPEVPEHVLAHWAVLRIEAATTDALRAKLRRE
jgi:hypothetical protein